MNRRDFIKKGMVLGAGLAMLGARGLSNQRDKSQTFGLSRADFGDNFVWGAASAAPQVEGACDTDGRTPSVWDVFALKNGNIRNNDKPSVATDFYNRFGEDIGLLKSLNFENFRFSISWSRIMPSGVGAVNSKGIDFYHRVIDFCLEKNITPWITLYHWDLPQVLQDRGGWPNRDVIRWFEEYTRVCAENFGDKVKNWMVLNEPMAFSSFGYMTGLHAPGHKSLGEFFRAVHHATMCQATGGNILRQNIPNANIGSTFSCSYIEPKNTDGRHIKAIKRLDALMNRLFIEPTLGMGYPIEDLKLLSRIEKYMQPDDEKMMAFDFDFIGLQNYFNTTARFALFPPGLFVLDVPANKRNVETNSLGWEVAPHGMYQILKQFAKYPIKKIIITENGICLNDKLINGVVDDTQRISYYNNYLQNVLRAKNEGVPVEGYFAWALTDNFEWAEGYSPRFGLVYVDFDNLQRTIKQSGHWFADFLK